MNSYYLYTDGGSRGNPGDSAIAAFIFDCDNNLFDFSGKYIGIGTNNSAEYFALIEGLSLAKKNKIEDLICYLDSELVVKQLNGLYKVKNDDMLKLYKKVLELKKEFKKIEFIHIERAKNKFADKLVNQILDGRK